MVAERGEYGHRLYIVCEGTVRLSSEDQNGEHHLIRRIDGDQSEPVFGTSAVLENSALLMIHANSEKRCAPGLNIMGLKFPTGTTTPRLHLYSGQSCTVAS